MAAKAAAPIPIAANDVLEIPLHGRIAAGVPIEAMEGQYADRVLSLKTERREGDALSKGNGSFKKKTHLVLLAAIIDRFFSNGVEVAHGLG